MRKTVARVGLTAAALAALPLSACSSSSSSGASGSTVRIGQEICQTGYLAASDTYLEKGAKLAVKLINDKGGVQGHKLQLITKDTQCVASNEIQLAHSLISQSHVNAIIGGYQSAAISGLVPVVKAAAVPLIGAGTLPLKSPWGVTTFPSNAYVAQAFLDYFAKSQNVRSQGNITGDTPFGKAVQALVDTEAKRLDVHTKDVQISNSATSTTPVLQQMTGVDAIFSNTSGPINIIFAKDASTLGMKKPLIFQDSLTTCDQAAAAYPKVYCVLAQAVAYPDISNPQVKAAEGPLYKLFKAEGGQLTNFAAVTAGADQVNLIAKAVTAAKSTSGKAVNTALSNTSYTGAQGVYKFTPGNTFGMTENPYVLVTHAPGKAITVVSRPASSGS